MLYSINGHKKFQGLSKKEKKRLLWEVVKKTNYGGKMLAVTILSLCVGLVFFVTFFDPINKSEWVAYVAYLLFFSVWYVLYLYVINSSVRKFLDNSDG
ncbi:hypothetical protein [Oceanicoccus sagamiensis]|uniref:Uncharacterized protein n=1 Tax=Oceanicoccus sagamiensis TaxID=716816 RepID=A0A1X9NAR9_9GAMM|nr:hypothetical protein [Oceanicoccus sagamiensis]ARN73532.1 hypothetical protein BST96_04995 [Oceanicoccus sagamiensis]